MSRIEAYAYKVRKVEVFQDWDPKTKKLTPMRFTEDENRSLYEILDTITLAAEAGVLDSYSWPQQLFADRESFDNFIGALSEYGECYRVADQWWTALAAIAGVGDEEGFVSSEEIAEVLSEVATTDGMLDNFGRKKPKLKYSLAQIKAGKLSEIKNSGSGGMLCRGMSRGEVRALQDPAWFGRHFDVQVSKAEYAKAWAEGVALATALDKPVAKKPAPKKAKA